MRESEWRTTSVFLEQTEFEFEIIMVFSHHGKKMTIRCANIIR